jgi:hypothetical protein
VAAGRAPGRREERGPRLDRARGARDIPGVLGASNSELALVGMLFLIVLVAPKIPRIGEWLGARFEQPGGSGPPAAPPPAPPRDGQGSSEPPAR